MIATWTSALLEDARVKFDAIRAKGPKYDVVFGRTTHQGHQSSSLKNKLSLIKSDEVSATNPENSFGKPNAKGAQSSKRRNSKCAGRQIMISKHDIDKAREKRRRQLRYSQEVQNSKRCYVALQISSITRIVVQSFRKLIDCERCALFLMDHSTDELYFKPVGDEHDSDPKEIRFPKSAGVAGYVATKCVALNIRDAYHDPRFNSEIDKQTNFRTRSILCAPVLSSTGKLFGVIQMVNKKKGDSKVIQSMAKKKKTDHKHHGYASCFEPFSSEDEQILDLCCARVSKSLEPILCPNKSTGKVDNSNQTTVSSSENNAKGSRKGSVMSCKERRRSSVGNLAQFVNSMETGARSATMKPTQPAQPPALVGVGVCEALTKFQFRTTIVGPQMSAKAQQKDDPERLIAATKRKRMVDYNMQRKFREKH